MSNDLLRYAQEVRLAAKELELEVQARRVDKSEVYEEDVSKEPPDIQAYRQALNPIKNKLQYLNFFEILLPELGKKVSKDSQTQKRFNYIKQIRNYISENIEKNEEGKDILAKFSVNDIIGHLKTEKRKKIPTGLTKPALKLVEEILNYLSAYGPSNGLTKLRTSQSFWNTFSPQTEKRRIKQQDNKEETEENE